MIGPRFDNWRRIFRGGVGLIALLILEKLAAQEPDLASTWETGPPPAWADVAPISPHAPTQAQQPGETTRYLLVDEQVHTAKSEYYTRRVYEVLNESGVQQNSTLSATYQPDYQSLILHTAAVWRGDALEEQLDAKRIRVVQEELDSASHVYRGEARAFLVLNDVRVGDRIEFAYTVRGRNPVLDGHYVGGFLTGWMVPVERIRFRVLWPGSRPIHWRAVRNDVSPDSRSNPDGTEMFWSLSNTAAEIVEPNTPSWYPPLPWVQLSDFDAWSDVAKWASQLFPQNLDLPPALETHLKDWSALSNDDEKAEAALQFVQNEIRYVGIEIGINSHRPSEPATVLTRRFGDCKDKTQLLIAILQRLGITAQPLLVNQAARGTITNWWPSPYAFNHAVVLAHGRTNQWLLDPTLSFQRGPLSARYVPDFGAGLIASPTSTQLIRLDSLARGTPYTRVDEDFRVAEKGQPSELIVTTRSSGLAAEIVRAQFASTPRSDLERGYRNYYARQYPTIEALNPIDFTDITNI
ncbi:MAG TPA: hypothetical protein DCE44_07370, partial [Verrucomicrobiales bacterium]|nr:hypothetical protein [Verrucomicrobiales bacterium]